MLIDTRCKALKGDLCKKDEVRKAMEKANFKSVRGNFKFSTNHFPIQNFYLQDAVKDATTRATEDGRDHRQQEGPGQGYVDKCNDDE